MTAVEPIRRVPLRTLWIKGIRTIWQLRVRLGIVWFFFVAVPIVLLNLRQNPRALQLSHQISNAQSPDMIEIIGDISRFMADSLSGYGLVFLSFSFGWMMTLVIANRYFQGFPQAGWRIVSTEAASVLLRGGLLAIASGLLLGAAGIAGFPILDLLAVILLMMPAYQIATKSRFFRSFFDCMGLRYGAHFKGGRFLTIVQLAFLSLFVSSLVIALNLGFQWGIEFFMTAGVSNFSQLDGAHLPTANLMLVILRDIFISTIVFLVPTYQITLFYWLYSIPRSMPANGIMV